MQTVTWCWRRLIVPRQEELWIGRFRDAGCLNWAVTERPGRSRLSLAIYGLSRAGALSLARKWGGRAQGINPREWLKPRAAKPIRIGNRLRIIHEKERGRKGPNPPRLHIPHGVAFGSGEHATTLMLLRALVHHENWNETTVLDLGTGSGILALTARLLGARKIVAADFDPEAVRTARQNEMLNFSTPLIHWRCADVKKFKATVRYGLVVANLFSGILCEAAESIAGCVLPGGRLWLTGVLRSQQDEVIAAYRRRRMKLVRVVSRGKWVMIQLEKNIPSS
jgi:ribosomal protein L11 methyltransferase